MSNARHKTRLMKELKAMKGESSSSIVLMNAEKLDEWVVAIHGVDGTLYAGETYNLRFGFSENYPMESPTVVFIGRVPIHPHIYSNGHICLDILYDKWSAALTVKSLCLSILSMLSSCKEKVKPPDNQHYIATADQSPREAVPRNYVLAVVLLASSFIIVESYILFLTNEGHKAAKANQWQVPGIQDAVTTSMTAYKVYNVIYILSQVYMIVICIEAVATANTIQVIAAVMFYFVCLVYAVTRYVGFYVLPSLTAKMFLRDKNMHTLQIGVIVMYCISLGSLIVLSWKLKKEVGWSVYKKLGADIALHRAYKWHQNLVMLLKLDIFFVGSYLIQMTALVLKTDNAETWLQITVFIPFSIAVIFCAFYALYGERRRLMSIVSLCLILSVGYFIFKIYRVCRAEILGQPGDPYEDSRPYFMISIVATMLLIIGTAAVSVLCTKNFDSGLKEAIEYERMRKKHSELYSQDKATQEEAASLVAKPDLTMRERFALE
ncbi:hypothetical protein GGI12_002788 [Dipsacomyces acuminosporus]|nr:hypothetical protein GGI12_002788 [Dipsacomyces acuminosporus]